MADTRDDHVEVRLLGVPVALYSTAREHHEALIREFSLIVAGDPSAVVPARLLDFATSTGERFAVFTAGPLTRLEAAVHGGLDHVDVTFPVPREAGEVAAAYATLLAEADEFCRSGRFLTLAAAPELARFASWFFGEFVRQTRGEPATQWPQAATVT